MSDNHLPLLKKLYPYLLIFVLSSIVYSQNLWFNFAYLDDNLIVFQEYDKINSISNIPNAFIEGYLYDTYYRPLVMISFIIDTAIAGQSSTMYHLTNLLIHICVSFLIYLLLKKITKENLLALIFAMLFSIHPININAVSWIAGRNDLLVSLFALLSFFTFIKYCDTNRIIFLCLSSLFSFLAMFSKETGILVPLILIFYFILFKSHLVDLKNKHHLKMLNVQELKKLTILFVVFSIPAIIYFIFRFIISSIKIKSGINILSFLQNFNIPFEYIAKTFYLFQFSPLSMANVTLLILGALISATVFIMVIVNKNIDRKIFLFGAVFFLIFILPPLFVRMPASDGEFNYIDCRFYLPLFGIMLILIEIIKSYKKNAFVNNSNVKKYAIILLTMFFSYTIIFSMIENQSYKNGKVFWSDILNKYPNRATYWMGLGYYYFDNKEFLKAANCAERAIELKPKTNEFYHKAAIAYEKAGDLIKANHIIEKVMTFEKDNSVNLINLIENNLKLGDFKKAETLKEDFEKINFTDLIKKSDFYSSASYYFGNYKKYDEAIELMHKASEFQPQNPSYANNLGVYFYQIGKVDSAKKYFSKAISLDPYNKEFQKNYSRVNK